MVGTLEQRTGTQVRIEVGLLGGLRQVSACLSLGFLVRKMGL